MQKNLIYILLALSIVLNIIMGIKMFQSTEKPNIRTPPRNSMAQDGCNEVTKNIYFIGNSILKPAKLDELLDNRNIANQSISGMTSTDAVMMSNELIPTKPKKVFIMLGINDIKSKMPLNITVRNIGHFIYTLKRYSPQTEIHLLSVLPVNETIKNYDIKNADIKELNKLIKEFCNRFNFNYIDLYDVLLDKESNLNKEFTTDGLHINNAAYLKLAKPLKVYTK